MSNSAGNDYVQVPEWDQVIEFPNPLEKRHIDADHTPKTLKGWNYRLDNDYFNVVGDLASCRRSPQCANEREWLHNHRVQQQLAYDEARWSSVGDKDTVTRLRHNLEDLDDDDSVAVRGVFHQGGVTARYYEDQGDAFFDSMLKEAALDPDAYPVYQLRSAGPAADPMEIESTVSDKPSVGGSPQSPVGKKRAQTPTDSLAASKRSKTSLHRADGFDTPSTTPRTSQLADFANDVVDLAESETTAQTISPSFTVEMQTRSVVPRVPST
jgi:hypothetical protein